MIQRLFRPDHILIALRDSEHANWQERRLIEHIEQRFDLPIITYAVDVEGHASTADGPLVLCYDGSDDARHAIRRAGALFPGIAQDTGLMAEPVAVRAAGPVWKAIVEVADREDASTIVLGSRGPSGLQAMLLGSVQRRRASRRAARADRPATPGACVAARDARAI